MKFKKFTVTFYFLFLIGCHNSHQKLQDKINSENPITVYSTDETKMREIFIEVMDKMVIGNSERLGTFLLDKNPAEEIQISDSIILNPDSYEFIDMVGSDTAFTNGYMALKLIVENSLLESHPHIWYRLTWEKNTVEDLIDHYSFIDGEFPNLVPERDSILITANQFGYIYLGGIMSQNNSVQSVKWMLDMRKPLPLYTRDVIYYSDSIKIDSLSSFIFSNAFQTEYMDSVGSTVLVDSEVELPFDLLYDQNQLQILEIAQVEEKDGNISIAIMKVLPKNELSQYIQTEFLLWAVSKTDNDSLYNFDNDPDYILMPYLDDISVFNEFYREKRGSFR